MKVKVVNKSDNSLPVYATQGSAGFDFYSNEDIILFPGIVEILKTGLFVEIPEGYELQVRPRSGLSTKGITLNNAVGTIDSDFRGEIGIIMINHSPVQFTISKGDRIAQGILNKYKNVEWEDVSELSETVRGEGGFGHTGKN